MVYQMPCPDQTHLFAASSVENEEQARQELELWASGHGYEIAQSAGTFTIFRGGNQPREWVLLEPAASNFMQE